ncbi:MAG: sigma-70 family RNA polymerase sigma factor [Roseburia sp.]|nr:sigma-70 family RNA polymerase sigma factor [Anaeroplasma bactoclasticum]MCM1195900.1 sigma-70 family RNA polymerase sigma factor [Roseburia sp.]MCM1556245.1 sigma-70 family RNA polymerase sigma factor [Anaeroplasma bactoclasticum]
MLLLKLLSKLFKKDEVCYLYNQMSLPEPLKEEAEKKYVEAMLEGDLEARNILIERNMRLVVFIAKRFESPKVLLEDLISIGSMGLIKGVETFKLDKNIKLATYASRCIENEILMFLRKVSKQKNEVSLDEALNVDGDGNELLLADVIPTNQMLAIDEAISNEKERIMYEAVEKLSAREKEIITLRFGLYHHEELTQKEVADKLGISQSYISRLEKKIIDKLKCEMEKKLTIVSK